MTTVLLLGVLVVVVPLMECVHKSHHLFQGPMNGSSISTPSMIFPELAKIATINPLEHEVPFRVLLETCDKFDHEIMVQLSCEVKRVDFDVVRVLGSGFLVDQLFDCKSCTLDILAYVVPQKQAGLTSMMPN